ncbi:MAG: response regulator transcription factor [Gammaproteobacteria bacterium]
MRVLLIEDETALREGLAARLRKESYAVDVAPNALEGAFLGKEYAIDVAVVDIGLPDRSGIEVIKEWRAAGRKFPILILTARSRWQDKVEGLEAGADDYVVKPFEVEELLARLRALVRRAAGWAEPVLRAGTLSLNTATQQVTVAGNEVDLTAYEYRVLEYLILHAGEVVSKTTLTEHLYAQDFDRDSNVLEVLIGRLRRKLDPDRTTDPIETLRGRGYRFRFEPQS